MYNLELEKAEKIILENKAKTVIIQLPDGLKPKSKEIQHYLTKKTKATILIWAGSCFGACDYPSNLNVDLTISWGHSKWN
jgi:2-(3-amino-3-carboxypropyl)histidine synthase